MGLQAKFRQTATCVVFRRRILFNLDTENGRIPDITAAGACSTPLGAVRIAKELKNEKGEACPVLIFGQACAISSDPDGDEPGCRHYAAGGFMSRSNLAECDWACWEVSTLEIRV